MADHRPPVPVVRVGNVARRVQIEQMRGGAFAHRPEIPHIAALDCEAHGLRHPFTALFTTDWMNQRWNNR